MEKNRLLICIILLLTTTMKVQAQPPKGFYNKYGGDGNDVGNCAIQTKDGGYVIVGSTTSNSGNSDVYLLKIDNMGMLKWDAVFGGTGLDVGKSVIELPDSGYAIAGFSSSSVNGFDALLIRLDKTGKKVWEKTYGGVDWDFANDVVHTSDGSLVIVGSTESSGSGKKDAFVAKYDMAGNLQWSKLFGGPEDDEIKSIIETLDQKLTMVGYTGSRDIDGDGWLIKLKMTGDTIYTRMFGGGQKDYANEIVQKPDSTLILCGMKTYSANTFGQSLMIAYKQNGDSLWENHYNSSNKDEEVIAMSNTSILTHLTAYLRNVPVPAFNTQGNILVGVSGGWAYKVNSFGGIEDEYCNSIAPTSDGGYIITGFTKSFGSIADDIFLIKLDSTCNTYTSIVDVKNSILSSSLSVFRTADGDYRVNFPSGTSGVIELYDAAGRSFEDQVDMPLVRTSVLPAGLYIIRVTTTSGESRHLKLIRNE